MNSGYCYLGWCVEYSKNAWGYQTWNILFEGKLTALWCSASFYAISFNFLPLVKLCFTLLHCIVHHQLLETLVFYLSTQMPIIDVNPCDAMIPFTEISCTCSIRGFPHPWISYFLKTRNEKIKNSFTVQVFFCAYTENWIVLGIVFSRMIMIADAHTSSSLAY